MKKAYIAAAFLAALAACGPKETFTGQTLRIDYWAEGDRNHETSELISMTRTSQWSGPLKNAVDTMDYGEYNVTMRDKASGEIIYLRGFCTLFGEWRTTAEAETRTEKYYSSVSVPMPSKPAVIDINVRDRKTMKFSSTGTFTVDPAEVEECRLPANDACDILISGDCGGKVDVTFLAEGYTASEKELFLEDVKRFSENLLACPPFDSCRSDFNIRAVMLASDSSGVDHPELGLDRSSALSSNYCTFGTDRYLTTRDMKAVADATWDVPTDAVVILANEPVYGGGGIYNFYAISSAHDKRSIGVFNHEFGHCFGALADEYFSSSVAYEEDAFYSLDAEPWEPNITTLVDFGRKWKDMLPEGAAVPTVISDSSAIPAVGVFEGGGYLSKGIYRPADWCMMRSHVGFCPVCSRAIRERIEFTCGR